MSIETRKKYTTNIEWHRDILEGEDVILCHTTALEHLGLFCGYTGDILIDVYSIKKGNNENINYNIVKSFDGIETVSIGNLLCTSVTQTFNDMLRKNNETDEHSLIMGLAEYYYENNESFDGLTINPENMNIFNKIKVWAEEYYDY